MADAHEDDWLVRVRAQVMCRDEGTGGWLPLGGGGLSNVMVRKRLRTSSGPIDALQNSSLLGHAPAAPPLPPSDQNIKQKNPPYHQSANNNNSRLNTSSPQQQTQTFFKHTPSNGSSNSFQASAQSNQFSKPKNGSSLSQSSQFRSANPLNVKPHQHPQQLGGSGGHLETLGQRGASIEERLGEDLTAKRLQKANGTQQNLGSGLKFEYFIYGKRISDQSVVLSCTIKKDFQYNKVMPTFHHWVTDEKRFGLTFQTAADARAFDKGVRTAIEDLLDGLGGAWPSLHTYKKHNPAPKDDEDDNIFECLNLPSDSKSSSENSTASRSHRCHTDQPQQPTSGPVFHLDVRHPVIYNMSENMNLSTTKELLLKTKLAGSCSEEPPIFVEDPLNAENYYVQLTQVHDYMYPSLGTGMVSISGDRSPSSQSTVPGSNPTTHSLLQRRDSGSSLKKHGSICSYPEPLLGYRPTRPPLPTKKRDRDLPKKPLSLTDGFHSREKCRHCQEWYNENSNKPGSCEYAPDCFNSCINGVSGMKCAQCMLYHCMSDAEGDFPGHPCACNAAEDGCTRRWLGLAVLSILVPCLWCYPPLKAVHWCCVGCGLTGGKHTPVRNTLHTYQHH
ncbi:sprouty-related protein with EVH-1 domain [Arctopsyche grandis]|uniref:sprouty-related protein with EVH-1 domain n=1 Tax=Arctopsyche grandis TaxID=121162 RepID=UPI00406D7AA5